MNWALVGAGTAGAILLAGGGLAWARRKRDGSINDAQGAAQAAATALAGFAPHGAIIGDDGAAALIVARDGRMAVVRLRRQRLAVREVTARMLVATPGGISAQTGDRRFGGVLLAGVDSLDVRRLVPEPARAA